MGCKQEAKSEVVMWCDTWHRGHTDDKNRVVTRRGTWEKTSG